MKYHTVFLLGKVTYYVDSENKALSWVENDIKNIHPKFNIEISGVKGVEEC